LLLVTFIGMAVQWGETAEQSKGAVVCRAGDKEPDPDTDCRPNVWKPENGASGGCTVGRVAPIPSGEIPNRALCPTTQRPVFAFCEHAHTGVKQPWATWSDLSFVATGLWLLWMFQFFAKPGATSSGTTTISVTADNPMVTIGWLSVTYGFIVIFMGPPSQWFHASLKQWAGWFDTLSVVSWLAFNGAYVIAATWAAKGGAKGRGPERTITVLGMWAGVVVACAVIVWFVPGASLVFYILTGVVWGVAELVYLGVARGEARYSRNGWLFGGNFLLLGATMTLWVFFNDGIISPTSCQGREGFPGHALFHVMASFSTVLTFFSFASERRVSA
jgi:hypothetical protein